MKTSNPRQPALENLLGALSRAVQDTLYEQSPTHQELGDSAVGALVTIHAWQGLSIAHLAEILHLTHPGTVRLVDKLVQRGWVEKRGSPDGRTVALHLSTAGERVRQTMNERRQALMANLLTALTEEEQLTLHRLVGKLLTDLPRTPRDAYAICRECSLESCSPMGCPVEIGCQQRMTGAGRER